MTGAGFDEMYDFDYVAARIHAMKSRLLSAEVLRALLALPDPEMAADRLSQTAYGPVFAKARADRAGLAAVDLALKLHLEDMLRTLWRLPIARRTRDAFRILLGRWDLENLKALVRGKARGAPVEGVREGLVPAAELDRPLLEELAAAADLEALLGMLRTLRIGAAAGLTQWREASTETPLEELEFRMVRAWYREAIAKARALRRMGRAVMEALQGDIDRLNVLLLLRALAEGGVDEAERWHLDGGRVPWPVLAAAASSGRLEDVLARIGRMAFAEAFERGGAHFAESGRVFYLERQLEGGQIRQMLRGVLLDPMSSRVLVAYVWQLYNEVTNLRMIFHGRAAGLPQARIEEEVVLV